MAKEAKYFKPDDLKFTYFGTTKHRTTGELVSRSITTGVNLNSMKASGIWGGFGPLLFETMFYQDLKEGLKANKIAVEAGTLKFAKFDRDAIRTPVDVTGLSYVITMCDEDRPDGIGAQVPCVYLNPADGPVSVVRPGEPDPRVPRECPGYYVRTDGCRFNSLYELPKAPLDPDIQVSGVDEEKIDSVV